MNKITMTQLKQKLTINPHNHTCLSWLISIIFLMFSITASAAETTDYEITSPVSGVIKHLHVTTGKTVKKGDLLLEFDDTLISSNLSEAQVNMKLARLDRAEAKKELERAEELYERTVLSEHDLQLAKVLFAKAEAQYATAKNQLVHAQWDVKHSKLYATFTGQVTRVLSYPGQYVNNQFNAQPLLHIKSNVVK